MTSYSLTALEVVMGGPSRIVINPILKETGVQGAIDDVIGRGKSWMSTYLQKGMGLDPLYADVLTEASGFGLAFGLSTIGAASKEKILEAAGDVAKTAKKLTNGVVNSAVSKNAQAPLKVSKTLKLERKGKVRQGVDATKSRVKLINGRQPRNSEYAGKTYPREKLSDDLKRKYQHEIPFTGTGHPDFSRYAIKKVEIKVTGKKSDFSAADRAAGYSKRPEGYTWHHHHDGKSMYLVPTDIHDAVKHTGGRAVHKEKARM